MRNMNNMVGPMDGRQIRIGGFAKELLNGLGLSVLIGVPLFGAALLTKFLFLLIGVPQTYFIWGVILGYIMRWVHQHI